MGMVFVDGWNWGLGDFVFAGVLIFGTGFLYEWVSSKGGSVAYRSATGLAMIAAFLLVWINAAVGIMGDGDLDSPNTLYLGMLLLGLVSAFVVRFHAQGMVRVLFGMAVAQMVIPLVALMVGGAAMSGAPGVFGVFILNAIFAAMWVGSALLFRKASSKLTVQV